MPVRRQGHAGHNGTPVVLELAKPGERLDGLARGALALLVPRLLADSNKCL
jgi:hypothetical protein